MLHRISPLILLFLLSACGEEFLDREPIDQIKSATFFQTESDMQSATRAIYTALQSQGYYGQAFEIEEIPSDDSSKSFAAGIDNFAANPNDNNILNYWNAHYRAITLANVVLEKGAQSDIDDEVLALLSAEAKFLRAISYFNLVRVFGGVPIITEVPELGRDLLPSRASVDEVYDFLRADLETAIDVLEPQHSPGRATQGAAQAYLANVELTLGNYEEARDLSRAVINSGVYRLLEDYGDLWTYPISDNNAESIFELEYAGCGPFGTGNQRQAFFAPFNQGITGNTDGWGVMVPTEPASGVPGTTALDVWEDGDLRRFWTILEPDNFYPGINPDKGGYTYPENGVGGRRSNVKKYVMGGGADVCFMSTPQNASLMRYSEVLWIFAESTIRLQGNTTITAEVLDLVNPLRERAGLSTYAALSLEDVELERRREFMFEGKRWFDILRKGSDEAATLLRFAGKTITEDKLLFPIPAIELEVNPNLDQNPGY